MGLYAAFDLHSNNAYLGIIDETGKRIFKKKLPNEVEKIKATLLLFKDDIEGIVVESTYMWSLPASLHSTFFAFRLQAGPEDGGVRSLCGTQRQDISERNTCYLQARAG